MRPSPAFLVLCLALATPAIAQTDLPDAAPDVPAEKPDRRPAFAETPAVEPTALLDGMADAAGAVRGADTVLEFTRPAELAGRWTCDLAIVRADAPRPMIVARYALDLDPSGPAAIEGATRLATGTHEESITEGEWGYWAGKLLVGGPSVDPGGKAYRWNIHTHVETASRAYLTDEMRRIGATVKVLCERDG